MQTERLQVYFILNHFSLKYITFCIFLFLSLTELICHSKAAIIEDKFLLEIRHKLEDFKDVKGVSPRIAKGINMIIPKIANKLNVTNPSNSKQLDITSPRIAKELEMMKPRIAKELNLKSCPVAM